jgi:hypothetical protein
MFVRFTVKLGKHWPYDDSMRCVRNVSVQTRYVRGVLEFTLYCQRIADVKATVPADKLLVFDVKQVRCAYVVRT